MLKSSVFFKKNSLLIHVVDVASVSLTVAVEKSDQQQWLVFSGTTFLNCLHSSAATLTNSSA